MVWVDRHSSGLQGEQPQVLSGTLVRSVIRKTIETAENAGSRYVVGFDGIRSRTRTSGT